MANNIKGIVNIKQTESWSFSIYIDGQHHWEKNIKGLMNSLLEYLNLIEINSKLQEKYNNSNGKIDFTDELRRLLVDEMVVTEDWITFDEVTKETKETLNNIEDRDIKETIKEELKKWNNFLSYWKYLQDNKIEWETYWDTWSRLLRNDLTEKSMRRTIAAYQKEWLETENLSWFKKILDIDQDKLTVKQAIKVWHKLYDELDSYFNSFDENWDKNDITNFDMVKIASNIKHPIIANYLSEYLAFTERFILMKSWANVAKRKLISSILWKRNWVLKKLKELSITPTIYDLKKIIEIDLLSRLDAIWTAQEIAALNSWKELRVEDWSWEFIWEEEETHEKKTIYNKKLLRAYYNTKNKKLEDSYQSWKHEDVIELWHFWQWTYEKTPLNQITVFRKLRKNPLWNSIDIESIKDVYYDR